MLLAFFEPSTGLLPHNRRWALGNLSWVMFLNEGRRRVGIQGWLITPTSNNYYYPTFLFHFYHNITILFSSIIHSTDDQARST